MSIFFDGGTPPYKAKHLAGGNTQVEIEREIKNPPEGCHYCPLLKKFIDDGLCEEIYHAQAGFLKKSAVPEVENWEKADETCPGCKHYFA